MKSSTKDIVMSSVMVAGVIGLSLLGARGCNMAFNNKIIDNEAAYQTGSYATGISGHVEYTKYSDNSQDVKIYPGFGHRIFDSELYQDINGDGSVDRIRQNGAEWKMNSLSLLLVREQDYDTHKGRFDEADIKLQELSDKYNFKYP